MVTTYNRDKKNRVLIDGGEGGGPWALTGESRTGEVPPSALYESPDHTDRLFGVAYQVPEVCEVEEDLLVSHGQPLPAPLHLLHAHTCIKGIVQ